MIEISDIGSYLEGRYRIEVSYEEDALNPRDEYDHVGRMACWHNRYRLGDEQPRMEPKEYYSRYIGQHERGGVVLPLYLLDHSGLTMRTTDFNDPWDSGQVGWIYCTGEQVRNCFVGDQAIARKAMQNEVEEYDQFLRGDVYWFAIHDAETDEILDSCGNMYGLDWVEENVNGFIKHLEQEVLG